MPRSWRGWTASPASPGSSSTCPVPTPVRAASSSAPIPSASGASSVGCRRRTRLPLVGQAVARAARYPGHGAGGPGRGSGRHQRRQHAARPPLCRGRDGPRLGNGNGGRERSGAAAGRRARRRAGRRADRRDAGDRRRGGPLARTMSGSISASARRWSGSAPRRWPIPGCPSGSFETWSVGMAEVIVALDLPSGADALRLLDRLPEARWVKVGSILMTREGPDLIRGARRARAAGVPGPQVARHPQHGGRGRGRGPRRSAWRWPRSTRWAARP